MNTNPKAKKILCFGDSNTWGRKPGNNNSARFPITVRWTGVLQSLLGRNFEVIEEGLNGRTTNLDSPDKAGKNGSKYLYSCLESQKPIDMIVLQLGKNDLKAKYNSTPVSVAKGIEECIQVIKEEGRNNDDKVPEIILTPVLVINELEGLQSGSLKRDFSGAHKKSVKLIPIYRKIAKKHNLQFADITNVAKVSDIDGVHIEEKSHKAIAETLAKIII